MMRYKLYKHKKQWIVGSTVLIMATLAGMTLSAQAATTTNSDAASVEPATTLT